MYSLIAAASTAHDHQRASKPRAARAQQQPRSETMAPTPVALVHVESPQTAVPTRAVEPGRTRRIAVAAPPLPAAALQRRTRVVLYYRTGGGVDGGGAPAPARLWEEVCWAKESLSEALADHPEMAGRLRRREDGSWEVKLNDAGMRFAQATAEATLGEFLAAVRDDKDRARSWEAALAPWADVNAEDPDMCALFYMQTLFIPDLPFLFQSKDQQDVGDDAGVAALQQARWRVEHRDVRLPPVPHAGVLLAHLDGVALPHPAASSPTRAPRRRPRPPPAPHAGVLLPTSTASRSSTPAASPPTQAAPLPPRQRPRPPPAPHAGVILPNSTASPLLRPTTGSLTCQQSGVAPTCS
ncbi:uncharacterized protein [Setaria viridis]|uniref:uncharacterized protein isoform X3 n=1 Tax=Setaria viridis TaxID=4556 RepID=UPI001493B495|nr:uncharacterized protein LOC117861457 isoform X3 [Setaria viridis]